LCHREELKRAESENKQLRESFMKARDKLELAQQDHQRVLNELHDQTARREGDMKEKIKALEKELQVLCPNCVIVLSLVHLLANFNTCALTNGVTFTQGHMRHENTSSPRTHFI